ncbi:terminase large subunit [environmental Halophage eHP-25]|nr:terminase large subunit [environmental Halophage eHP-25]
MINYNNWIDTLLEVREHLKTVPNSDRMKELKSIFTSEESFKKAVFSPWLGARKKQLEVLQSDADTILILAGRGWGKNWIGGHWLLDKIARGHKSTAAVAETAADVRDDLVDPAEDNSGIIDFARQKNLQPNYKSSQARVELQASHGESRIQLYSGDSPNSLRGFSGSVALIDELAKMRYQDSVLSQANLTLREGNSQLLVTTTPRPTDTIRKLVEDEDVHVITGSSWENEANLDSRFIRQLEKLEGTRLGRQEVGAEILDSSGDLWSHDDIHHVDPDTVPELKRICIGLDPTVSNSEGDEAGIVVVGLDNNEVCWVLEDLSGQYTTSEWGAVTVAAYQGNIRKIRQWLSKPYSDDVMRVIKQGYTRRPADCIHAETNQGGALVEQQLRTYGSLAVVNSTHATHSKQVRAEPIHHLYQRGRVVHVGNFPELEDQMTDFLQGSDSPDRADALVWAINELMINDQTSSLKANHIIGLD